MSKQIVTDIYDTIYKRLITLIPDLREMQRGQARVSKSDGFMDLHLDILSKDERQMRIALHHSYIQNGDTMMDPDMEIRVYLRPNWQKAEALTFQQDGTLARYDEVYSRPGYVNPELKRNLNTFLAQWLKNCIDQGHSLSPNGREVADI